MCTEELLGISDSSIFGIGQVVIGAAIAVWAIFKTRKDANKLQNENIKYQMQNQIRTQIISAYRELRHSRELLDAEFVKDVNSLKYKSNAILVANQYFPRLRSVFYAFLENLSVLIP